MSSYFKARGWFEDQQSNVIHDQHRAQDLLRVTQHAGRKPYNSILDWGIYFPFLAQCVRLKKFAYPQVSDSVRYSNRLKCAIKQSVEDIMKDFNLSKQNTTDDDKELNETLLYQKELDKEEKRAIRIIMEMRSKLSDVLLRITSWILYKLLPCFLSGVVTHTKQIEMLKTATEKAPGVPLIFLPLHRSHLDYIMVSFILLNNDIRSPIVAAGSNLQIPLFGFLLRGLGAFFIKRKIDPIVGKKDIVYRAVLHLYLQHALEAGHNMEFFIEGGRTRTGKPCMPKNGILSVIVSAFMDGAIKDALLVPVSVNYERLVDGNFVPEQLGQRKKPETFRSAIAGIWKALNSKYGLMRIDFNQPFSIKELVQSYNEIAKEEGSNKIYKPAARPLQHNQSSSSLYGTDVVCEEHRTLVDSISRQVVYDCTVATSVMTTNAVAFILLTKFRNGASSTILADALDNLRQQLKGKKDIGFSGDSLQIVRYASDLLGPNLIKQEQRGTELIIKPVTALPNVVELAYYSNALTPHFALESIVITAMHVLSEGEDKGVLKRRLKDACIKHCEVLRYEFILSKPTQNLENLLEEIINNLCEREILTTSESETISNDNAASKRLATFVESTLDCDDMNYFEDTADIEIFLTKTKQKETKDILSVLAPFGYSYATVACMLEKLIGNAMLEIEFIKLCINQISKDVQSGECPFGESVSTESVKNCLKFLEKIGILEIRNEHGVRLLTLENEYDSSYGVESIIDRINATVWKNIVYA